MLISQLFPKLAVFTTKFYGRRFITPLFIDIIL